MESSVSVAPQVMSLLVTSIERPGRASDGQTSKPNGGRSSQQSCMSTSLRRLFAFYRVDEWEAECGIRVWVVCYLLYREKLLRGIYSNKSQLVSDACHCFL
jgi:hypothetical protein